MAVTIPTWTFVLPQGKYGNVTFKFTNFFQDISGGPTADQQFEAFLSIAYNDLYNSPVSAWAAGLDLAPGAVVNVGIGPNTIWSGSGPKPDSPANTGVTYDSSGRASSVTISIDTALLGLGTYTEQNGLTGFDTVDQAFGNELGKTIILTNPDKPEDLTSTYPVYGWNETGPWTPNQVMDSPLVDTPGWLSTAPGELTTTDSIAIENTLSHSPATRRNPGNEGGPGYATTPHNIWPVGTAFPPNHSASSTNFNTSSPRSVSPSGNTLAYYGRPWRTKFCSQWEWGTSTEGRFIPYEEYNDEDNTGLQIPHKA